MNQLRTRASVLATPLLGALLLAGCAVAGAQAPVTGHLAGRLVMEGGPIGPGGRQPGERPVPGTVTVTAAGHEQVTVQAGPSGTFSVRLPPGLYQVCARTPDIPEVSGGSVQDSPCSQPSSVTVTAGHTATVAITFIVP